MTHIVIGPGRMLDLMKPDVSLIDLGDIVDGLELIRRFGPLRSQLNWTVAQHTILVASLCSEQARPYALLHDAHEHYLGDDVTPKKQAMARAEDQDDCAGLEIIQLKLDRAIHRRAELQWPPHGDIALEVKNADLIAYVTEVVHLMPADISATFDLTGMPAPAPREVVSKVAAGGSLRWHFRQAFPRAFGE